MKEDDMEEAVGDSAEAFYDMQDEFAGGEAEGAHKVLIDELVRYLSGDQIADFVDDFKRHHITEATIEEDDIDENAFNQAAADAARKGDSHFTFNGKKYKTSMDKSTAHKLDDDVQMSEGGHKDEIIDDAQSMDLEDFIEKHEGYGMDREECIAQWKYINNVKESSLEEGRMSDQIIHDSETMSKEEFAKKHGKEMADEYFESVVSEAPTMDTTQLITLLKNAGLSEEAIQKKLNEWANTPDNIGEVEAREHGDAYDFAQGVNLSLKKYLDAENMKVNVQEHTKENMKALYEAKKNK